MIGPHPLAILRSHAGYGLADLSDITGVPASVFAQIEAGTRDPSPRTYAALASMGIDVVELSASDVTWNAERRRAIRDAIQAGCRAPHLNR